MFEVKIRSFESQKKNKIKTKKNRIPIAAKKNWNNNENLIFYTFFFVAAYNLAQKTNYAIMVSDVLVQSFKIKDWLIILFCIQIAENRMALIMRYIDSIHYYMDKFGGELTLLLSFNVVAVSKSSSEWIPCEDFENFSDQKLENQMRISPACSMLC